MPKQELESWLKNNTWNLVITFAGIIAAFALANYRINAMEMTIAKYPSQDYFELKFKTIDKSIQDLIDGQKIITDKLDDHLMVK